MEDDLDLEGLSVNEARTYVAGFITSLKAVQRQREETSNEFDLWKKRVRLATDNGETSLARDALERAEETHRKLVRLKKEEVELDFKVGELKKRLGKVRDQPRMTVDADALLTQLEGVVGTDHETRDALSEAEAEIALEKLRRKIQAEDGTSSDDDAQ